MIKCPFEAEGTVVTAEVQGFDRDPDLGYERVLLRCTNGHTWYKPSHRFLIYSMHYGNDWVTKLGHDDAIEAPLLIE